MVAVAVTLDVAEGEGSVHGVCFDVGVSFRTVAYVEISSSTFFCSALDLIFSRQGKAEPLEGDPSVGCSGGGICGGNGGGSAGGSAGGSVGSSVGGSSGGSGGSNGQTQVDVAASDALMPADGKKLRSKTGKPHEIAATTALPSCQQGKVDALPDGPTMAAHHITFTLSKPTFVVDGTKSSSSVGPISQLVLSSGAENLFA